MMVIGVDAHKATHTAAAVNRQTAELLEQLTVDAREHGHQHLLDWARELDDDRVWAIEDARNLSGALERHLLGAGERVLGVPPKLMAMQRKSARTFSKSDPIDALAVARAAIREPNLPQATMPGTSSSSAGQLRRRCPARRIVGTPATPPPQPHRQPPAQPHPARHRRHPDPHAPTCDGLPAF